MQAVVRGHSMSPLIADGAVVDVVAAPVALGSVVVVRSAVNAVPLIKRVVAAPGQSLSISDGRIVVDGVTAATSDGRPYRLPAGRCALLSLYAGVLAADAYLVLGDDPAGTDDSSLFGLVHVSSIIGVVATKD